VLQLLQLRYPYDGLGLLLLFLIVSVGHEQLQQRRSLRDLLHATVTDSLGLQLLSLFVDDELDLVLEEALRNKRLLGS